MPGADQSLALGEPVVPRSVWVLSVKLPEFLQTSYREVVVWLLCSVLPVWVVEPSDEVQDAAPFLGAPKDLVNVVLLALFDVVGLAEYLRGVWWRTVFTELIGFEQQHMEDIVNLPLPGKGEPNSEGRDDFLHLEGTIVLVVRLPEWPARFDVAPIENYQVPDLILRGLGALGVHVATHAFVRCLQSFGGLLVYRVHLVSVECAGGVQGSFGGRVGGHGVKTVVGLDGVILLPMVIELL